MERMTKVTNNHGSAARKSVTVLGSTGSIGLSTVDVLLRDRAAYDIMALTANSRVDALIEQALQVRPRRAVIGDERHYRRLCEGLAEAASRRQRGMMPSSRLPVWTQNGSWQPSLARQPCDRLWLRCGGAAPSP